MPGEEKANRQSTYYMELQKYIHSGDYEKAVKSCNRLLHDSPDDELAFRCKIIALINLGRYEDVLTFCGKNPNLTENLKFEIGYCYYRLNRAQEALEALDKIDDAEEPRKKELYCQILYRLERFEECYDLYKEVIKETSDNYEDERQSNMTAIAASLRIANTPRKLIVEKGETFEHLYNHACFLVAEHKYEIAQKYVEQAMTVCEETLREEMVSDDEIQEELCVMKALRGYILQKLGRDKEASRIYAEILKARQSDASTAAIVANNIVVQNKDQNVFDSRKRIKTMSADEATYKLTAAQKLTIQINQCLYFMFTHQYDLCKKIYTSLLEDVGKECDEIYAIAAYHALFTGERNNIIEQKYLPYVRERPELELKIRLGSIQVLLALGEVENAIKFADDLTKQSKFPLGITSMCISLLRLQGNKDDASRCFKDAIDHHLKNTAAPEQRKSLEKLLKQAAAYEIEDGNKDRAQAILRQLLEFNKNPDVLGAALMLTVSLDLGDKHKMKNLMSSLPKPKMDEGFNLDSIESDAVLGNLKYVKKTPRGAGDSGTIDKKNILSETGPVTPRKPKKKKKKKAKLPQNYDPDRVPDPERWLPRYERSGFKQKKTRRGRADVGKGTQGAASEASEVYDMSKGNRSAPSGSGGETTPRSDKKKGNKKKGKH